MKKKKNSKKRIFIIWARLPSWKPRKEASNHTNNAVPWLRNPLENFRKAVGRQEAGLSRYNNTRFFIPVTCPFSLVMRRSALGDAAKTSPYISKTPAATPISCSVCRGFVMCLHHHNRSKTSSTTLKKITYIYRSTTVKRNKSKRKLSNMILQISPQKK